MIQSKKICECLACDRKDAPAQVCWRCYNRERLEAQNANVELERLRQRLQELEGIING